jgi:hypothetical protein
MRTLCILAALAVTGCDIKPVDRSGEYLAGLSIVCGVSSLQSPQVPAPQPEPSDKCQSCDGQGWLGDGRPRADCPDCDRDGDGDNADPLPAQDAALPALGQDAPEAVAWLSALQAATYTFDKPLVLIAGDPEFANAVRDALGPDAAAFSWRMAEGERSVSVLRSRDGDALQCDATDPAEIAGLLRGLE